MWKLKKKYIYKINFVNKNYALMWIAIILLLVTSTSNKYAKIYIYKIYLPIAESASAINHVEIGRMNRNWNNKMMKGISPMNSKIGMLLSSTDNIETNLTASTNY